MSRGAALGLLMRIYMNEKRWADANNVCDQIIALGHYKLLDKYADVFDIANEGPSNKEVMMIIGRIISNTSFAWTWAVDVLPGSPVYKPETNQMSGISGGLKMPWEFYDKFEGNDDRLSGIVRYYYSAAVDTLIDFRTVVHAKQTGACPMKYSEDPDQVGANQGNDVILLRYADVLLSKAEAMNQLNGPTDACIELINQVRRRAKVSELKTADFTKETLNDFILEERGRELYCEGVRRDDLIRHGKFVSAVAGQGKHPEAYMALYPIPQSVIDENPKIKQNDGY